MKNRKKYKAVIFDKDGVLVDSLDTCLAAFNIMLEHYGKRRISKEFFTKDFWGVSGTKNIESIFGELPEEKIEEMYRFYVEKRMGLEREMTKLYPSARPVLEQLKGKYKIGIVTNSMNKVALKILEDFGISEFFDAVIGSDDVEQTKPAPEPIFKACELLGAAPEESVYIGDTTTDLKTGKAAGCTTVIVTTSMAKEELDGIEKIIVIDDLKEILEIV